MHFAPSTSPLVFVFSFIHKQLNSSSFSSNVAPAVSYIACIPRKVHPDFTSWHFVVSSVIHIHHNVFVSDLAAPGNSHVNSRVINSHDDLISSPSNPDVSSAIHMHSALILSTLLNPHCDVLFTFYIIAAEQQKQLVATIKQKFHFMIFSCVI
jgi:hypothetical protein